MLFVYGCAIGLAVGLLLGKRWRKPPVTDEMTALLSRRSAREYRNFMTYDGFTEQEGYDE